MPSTRKTLKSNSCQCLYVTFSIICHMKIERYFFLNKILYPIITNLLHVALALVFRDSITHSYLTGLFHHNPRDKNPLWIQHTKSWKMLEAVFNIFQAPLIFSIVPMLIHKPCMWGIQEDAQKISFPAKKKKKKRTFIQPIFTKHQDCRVLIWYHFFSLGSHSLEEETDEQKSTVFMSASKSSQIIEREKILIALWCRKHISEKAQANTQGRIKWADVPKIAKMYPRATSHVAEFSLKVHMGNTWVLNSTTQNI